MGKTDGWPHQVRLLDSDKNDRWTLLPLGCLSLLSVAPVVGLAEKIRVIGLIRQNRVRCLATTLASQVSKVARKPFDSRHESNRRNDSL